MTDDDMRSASPQSFDLQVSAIKLEQSSQMSNSLQTIIENKPHHPLPEECKLRKLP